MNTFESFKLRTARYTDIGMHVISGYLAIRILLGTVLLTAGVLKGHELTTSPVVESNLITSRLLLVGLVGFEVLFGLWLLVGLHPRLTRRVALACFSGFACIALYKALSGETTCGCFGGATISPWYILMFDLAAVVGLLRWRPTDPQLPTIRSSPFRVAVFLMIGLWVGIPWVMAMGHLSDDDNFVVLEPETWTGKCFPLLEHIEIGDELTRGRWTLVLYHHDCSACQRAIPKYKHLARESAGRPDAPRIALIEMPPYGGPDNLVSYESPCTLGRLDDSKVWFIKTPAEISLRDCIVIGYNEEASPE